MWSRWASTSTGSSTRLSLVEGSTENATLTRELLVGLRERGLNTTRPVLAVLDGGKALRRAVLDVFDHPINGRVTRYKGPPIKAGAPASALRSLTRA